MFLSYCKQQFIKLRAVNCFDLDQMFRNGDKFILLFVQNVQCSLIGLFDQQRNLLVDPGSRLSADGRITIRFSLERNKTKRTHTKFTYHTPGYVRDVLDILARSCRDVAKDDLLSG